MNAKTEFFSSSDKVLVQETQLESSNIFVKYLLISLSDSFGSYESIFLLVLTLLAGLGLLLVKIRSGNQSILGSAYFAGVQEKLNAMKTALSQSQSSKIDELALFIGREEGQEFTWYDRQKVRFLGKLPFTPMPGLNKGLIGVGPPEVGKTYSLQKPLLRDAIRQGKTIICLDPKGDLASEMAPFAKSRGYECYFFAPGYPYTHSFNILDFIESVYDSGSSEQIGLSIRENSRAGGTDGKSDPFFDSSGLALVRSVLLLAKDTDKPDLVTAKKLLASPDLVARLREAIAQKKLNAIVADSLEQLVGGKDAERTIACIVATAMLNFDGFTRPEFMGSLLESTIPKKLEGKQI